jgi:hypothetical protein
VDKIVNVSTSTAGLFERGGVYSWLLWGVVTGVLVLAKQLRGAAVGQNVPV